MLTFTAEQLLDVTQAMFEACGTPADIAAYVARTLVDADLMGHESHGIIRVPTYIDRGVATGRYVADARPAILNETATTAVVKGNWAFGQLAAKFATEVAIGKAKEMNIAAVTVIECNHVGRLGEYSTMIAREGMVGMVVTGGFSAPANGVAPYGGAGRALGTNPYSFAVPAGEYDLFLADFATSVVAEGKLQVARAKHLPVAEGVIIDAEGHPTTDPNAFYQGGALQTFGRHKGYCLSVLADLLGSLLSGAETVAGPPWTTGTFIMALRIDIFRPLAEFTRAVDKRFDEIKSIPPAPGFEEVLIPGEPESRTMALRQREGIPVPEDTWERILATASKYDVNVERLLEKSRDSAG